MLLFIKRFIFRSRIGNRTTTEDRGIYAETDTDKQELPKKSGIAHTIVTDAADQSVETPYKSGYCVIRRRTLIIEAGHSFIKADDPFINDHS